MNDRWAIVSQIIQWYNMMSIRYPETQFMRLFMVQAGLKSITQLKCNAKMQLENARWL